MSKSRQGAPAAQRIEKAFRRFDLGIAMTCRRLVAMMCFAVAAYQTNLAWAERAKFETAGHYVGTALFVGLFLVAGVALWRSRQALTDAIDEVGQRR